ncbi:MAG: hypothetical protein ACI8PW_001955 [Methylophilaceae bacterium]|jgi:hypothetical protein
MNALALSRLIFSCCGLAVPLWALLVVVRSPVATWVAIILRSAIHINNACRWICRVQAFVAAGTWVEKHYVLLCSNCTSSVYQKFTHKV